MVTLDFNRQWAQKRLETKILKKTSFSTTPLKLVPTNYLKTSATLQPKPFNSTCKVVFNRCLHSMKQPSDLTIATKKRSWQLLNLTTKTINSTQQQLASVKNGKYQKINKTNLLWLRTYKKLQIYSQHLYRSRMMAMVPRTKAWMQVMTSMTRLSLWMSES